MRERIERERLEAEERERVNLREAEERERLRMRELARQAREAKKMDRQLTR